jgi:hypothetical protein
LCLSFVFNILFIDWLSLKICLDFLFDNLLGSNLFWFGLISIGSTIFLL